jgi:hypothetical protein
MTRFHVEIRYDADPDAVARAYADTALYDAFGRLPRAGPPRVVDSRTHGETVELRVRWKFAAPLSSAARRVIDPDKLTWVVASRHDVAARRATFVMEPDHYRDRFTCSGEYRFEADGGGTVRIIDGDLRVKAPLVARAVESAILSGLEEQLRSEVPVVEEFLGQA